MFNYFYFFLDGLEFLGSVTGVVEDVVDDLGDLLDQGVVTLV